MDEKTFRNYYKFDEADLAANRNGEFSNKQKKNLVMGRGNTKVSSLKVGWALVAVACLLLVVSIIFFKTLGLNVIVSGIFMLLFGAAGWFFLQSGYEAVRGGTSRDIIRTAQGPIRVVATLSSDHYYLRVGGKEFPIQAELADQFKVGDTYAIYYDDFDNRVVSVEAIPKK